MLDRYRAARTEESARLLYRGPRLGLHRLGFNPWDPRGTYYVAQVRGKDVAGIRSLLPGGALPRPEWITYVAVKSADVAATRAREAGGVIVAEPFDASPSGRMAVLRDPAGAVFGVWQARLRRGAQLVN